MRRPLVSVLAAALLLTATAACGGDDPADGGLIPVKVGAIPIVDVAPLHLGVAKGFFRQQGLDVEIIDSTGGSAVVPGVVSGQFDFAFANVVSIIVARSQGIELKALAEGNSSTGKQGDDFCGLVVAANSPIKSARQLTGRTVAINNLKNISETSVRASIRKAGGDPSGVSFVEMPFPEMPAAVASRRVDAALVVEPVLTIAKDQGTRVIASSFVDAAPNLTVATYFTSQQTLDERPDVATRFTAAITKSLAYAQSHPQEARQALLTYTQIAPEVANRLTLPAWPAQINRTSVATLSELMVEDGLVTRKVDVAAMLP
jgi:NitT/TauT family transport system substrate-binding protein